jgi:hypothetical protein
MCDRSAAVWFDNGLGFAHAIIVDGHETGLEMDDPSRLLYVEWWLCANVSLLAGVRRL